HELSRTTPGAASALSVSPDSPDSDPYNDKTPERAYAWLTSQGVFHGKLLNAPADANLGTRVFSDSKMLAKAQIITPEGSGRRRSPAEMIDAIALTQWHILSLIGGRVVATNRLTGQMVSEHDVLDPGQRAVGFSVDI